MPKTALLLLFAIITVNSSENKFNIFKNATRSSQNQGSSDHTDLIKPEIKKFLSECGADGFDEDGSESQHNNRNSTSSNNSQHNRGDSYTSGRYGNNRDQNDQQNRDPYAFSGQNSNRRSSSGYGNYRTGQGYGSSAPNRDFIRDQSRDPSAQTGYGNWGSSGRNSGSYPSSNGNVGFNRSGYGNYEYGHEPDGYGGRNGGGMSGGGGNYGSYSSARETFDSGYIRPKRSDDNIECISQCVFGYLEVLDDNRSPSEGALIKWLQDHIPNDGKRIKAIRDTRRCFARLAVADNEDGCEFSKSLSKCLNWEIEK